jgi:hypothetical protein
MKLLLAQKRGVDHASGRGRMVKLYYRKAAGPEPGENWGTAITWGMEQSQTNG